MNINNNCLIFIYIGAIAATAIGSTIDYVWPHHIIDLNCTGNEDNIWYCPYNGLVVHHDCFDSHDAIVSCQSKQMMQKLLCTCIRY